jgi:hypothetical protein
MKRGTDKQTLYYQFRQQRTSTNQQTRFAAGEI